MPFFEEWESFYVIVGAAAGALSAWIAVSHTHDAFLGAAVAVLLLLFIGIHNAWDAIAYHVFVNMRKVKD